MIINGKSVIGIYKYVVDAEYEKGDFVVYDGCLYICNAVTSDIIRGSSDSEKTPNKDTINFTIYLGNKTASKEDYFNYLKDKEKYEDKYVSMFTLSDILQSMYFGLDDSGVISNYIDSPSEFNIYGLENLDESISPLDSIISSPDLNNGVLRVSRSLDELRGLLEQLQSSDEKSYFSKKYNKYVILKQYTYNSNREDSNDKLERYRVQELIDPIFGNIYYRYSIGTLSTTGVYEFNTVSSWLNSFSGDKVLGKRINGIENYYEKMTNDYKNKLVSLGNTFRFKYLEFEKESDNIVSFSLDEGADVKGDNLVTVLIQRELNSKNHIFENYSVTINTIYCYNNNSTFKVAFDKISDTNYATLSVIPASDGSIKLSCSDSKYKITGIYYQSNFVVDNYNNIE